MKVPTFEHLCLVVALALGLSLAWSAISPGQPGDSNRGAQCHNRCAEVRPNDCSIVESWCQGNINGCMYMIGTTPDCDWDHADCTGSGCGGWWTATDCDTPW